MKIYLSLCFFLVSLMAFGQQRDYAKDFKQLYNEELTKGQCYQTLDYLCNQIGGRLSGSPQAEQAVEYMFAKMPTLAKKWVKKYGAKIKRKSK